MTASVLPASQSNIAALRHTDGAAPANAIVMAALRAGGKPHFDSRLVKKGDVFFALTGGQTDGHSYVADAADAGAAVIVVKDNFLPKSALPNGAELVKVPDTLICLQEAGRARRLESKAKVIAVTGSVGKTGTKETLRFILSYFGKCHATDGNYNNHIGVPLTLAALPADADFAVIEAGMNASGELDVLTGIILPDIVIVTTVQPAHEGNFSGTEAIAHAKAELLEGLLPEGTAILGGDHMYLDILSYKAKQKGVKDIRTVGMQEGGFTAYIKDYLPANPASTVGFHYDGKDSAFLCGLRGRHQGYCTLLALLAAEAAGVAIEEAAEYPADLRPLKGRGQETRFALKSSPGIPRIIIDESYNASPKSVFAAVVSAKTHYPKDGVFLVLGDMLEMGNDTARYYKYIGAECEDIAGVVTIGEDSKVCSDMTAAFLPFSRHYPDSDTAAQALVNDIPDTAKVIVVKGSRGIRTEKVIAALTSDENRV